MTNRVKGALLTTLTVLAMAGTPVSILGQSGDTLWPTYQHDNQHTGRSVFAIED